MRYFDVNCFLGEPFFPLIRSFSTAKELLQELDDIGIEQAMVCHFLAQDVHIRKGNQLLMREIKGYKRLFPCWILNPHHFSKYLVIKDILRQLKDEGIRMVRFQPGTQNQYSLHIWAMDEFLFGLAEENIILYIDVIMSHRLSHYPVPEDEWQRLYALAKTYPSLNIILFAPKLSISRIQVMGLLKSCPNVRLDISSFQAWRATEILCQNFGPERLIFGSFMPYFDPSQFMVQIAYAQVPKEAKEKMASLNLAGLIGKNKS